jgi:hypothetical protein
MDAQHQLGEVERLGQVVIRAEAQAADPVTRFPGRGQHEHHDPLIAGGDHLAEGVAVQAGQVAVEHDNVVAVSVQLGRRGEPVPRHIHRHALIARPFGQHVGERSRIIVRSGRSICRAANQLSTTENTAVMTNASTDALISSCSVFSCAWDTWTASWCYSTATWCSSAPIWF